MSSYRDSRTLEQLVGFAKKMSNDPVSDITPEEFEAYKKDKDAFFLFLHGRDQGTDDIEKLAKRFISTSAFYSSSDSTLARRLGVTSTPALVAVQNGEVSTFKGHEFSAGVGQDSAAEAWIKEHRLPLFGGLDFYNTDFFLSTEDLVVILIADPGQSSFSLRSKPEMAKAAIQFHREHQQGLQKAKVHFVWLDGSKWFGFASKSYGISSSSDLPLVIVANAGNGEYYEREKGAAERVKIEAKELLAFVRHVQEGQVEGYSIGGAIRGMVFSVQKALTPLAVSDL